MQIESFLKNVMSGGRDRPLTRQVRSLIMDVIGSIDEGFALYDADSRLILWNEKLLHMFPSLKPLAEKNATFVEIQRHLLASGDVVMKKARHEEWIQMRLDQLAKDRADVEYQLSDGRWIKVSNHRTSGGNVVAICRDVTDTKSREDRLVLAKEMAEASNRTKNTFLAHVSHELRTPLNAIIGFSSIMDQGMFGPIDNPQYKEYMGDILHSAQHLLGVIDDILNVSRAEVGQLELNESTFSMTDLVHQVSRMLELRVADSEVAFDIKIRPNIPPLCADERKIKQILLNLLVNALKFTPAGGRVSLSIDVNPAGELFMIVEDTGIGMSDDEIPRALEAFSQIENPMSRNYKGSGLGLYLTNMFVKLHDGNLHIESEKGKGTRMTVTLPAIRFVTQGLAKTD